MWKSKKVVFVALVIAALMGSTAGVAFAQIGNGDESQPEARYEALLDRVCEIYEENTGVAIDPQQLKDAFAQVRREIQDEALDRYLQNLVDQGKITQDEADQYKEWWQARPDTPLPGRSGRDFGFNGFGGVMKWGRGHHCWGGPYAAPEASDSGL